MTPKNYITKRPYTGRNEDTLIMQGKGEEFFMTFAQGLSIGKVVKKGEKGIALIMVKESKNENGEDYKYKRGFTVFGLSQFKDRTPEPEKTAIEKPADPIREPEPEVKPEPVKPQPKSVQIKSCKTGREKLKCKYPDLYVISGEIWQVEGNKYNYIADANLPTGYIRADDKAILSFLKMKMLDRIAACIQKEETRSLPELTEYFRLDISILKDLLLHSSEDIVKPAFYGVTYRTVGAYLASDSRRLAAHFQKAEVITELKSKETEFIISRDHIKAAKSDIKLCKTKHGQWFSVSDDIIFPLVDGQFPDYKQVIPKEYIGTITLDDSRVAEAAKIGKAPAYKMTIGNSQTLDVQDIGRIDFPLGQQTKMDIEIGVNAKYLHEAMAFAGSNIVNVSGVMSPLSVKSDNRISIVMPIQIKNTEK